MAKEMQYISPLIERVEEVLDKGTYRGYDYLIMSFGTHPCAYVAIPKKSKYHGLYYDDVPVQCHGGLTFSSARPDMDGQWCIGWDYTHAGDYTAALPDFNERRWTTAEIQAEVRDVIDQLIKLEP